MIESRHFGALLRLAQAAYAVHLKTGSDGWLWDAIEAADECKWRACNGERFALTDSEHRYWKACRKFAERCYIIALKRYEEIEDE